MRTTVRSRLLPAAKFLMLKHRSVEKSSVNTKLQVVNTKASSMTVSLGIKTLCGQLCPSALLWPRSAHKPLTLKNSALALPRIALRRGRGDSHDWKRRRRKEDCEQNSRAQSILRHRTVTRKARAPRFFKRKRLVPIGNVHLSRELTRGLPVAWTCFDTPEPAITNWVLTFCETHSLHTGSTRIATPGSTTQEAAHTNSAKQTKPVVLGSKSVHRGTPTHPPGQFRRLCFDLASTTQSNHLWHAKIFFPYHSLP